MNIFQKITAFFKAPKPPIETVYVNLLGGPSSGKSTTAARLFSEFKLKGHESEVVTEYAKDKVWEGTTAVFGDQFYISAKQWHRLFCLQGKVEFVVTDSPILMSATYADDNDHALKNLIVDRHHRCKNVNIFVNRDESTFSQNGRLQNLEESKLKDTQIRNWIIQNDDIHLYIDKYIPVEELYEKIQEFLRENQTKA